MSDLVDFATFSTIYIMLDDGREDEDDEVGRENHDEGPPAAGSHLRDEERDARTASAQARYTVRRRAMYKYHSCRVDPRYRAGSGYIPRGRGSIGIKD